MSELKRISPMLDDFDVGGVVSEHAGVRCYPAMRKGTDDRYIIKTVSIPASQTQLDALLLTGAFTDAAAALTYFQDLTNRTVEELEILQQLSLAEGFMAYDSWQSEAKDDGIGFNVYMISPYKRTLRKLMNKQPMTHLGAINLGLDICTALTVCRRAGYLYADLKPNNIYVVDDSQYRIGDIGFIPLDSLAYASLPDKYRSEYTAPELNDPFAALTPTLDVYALGMILYQIYNSSELPTADENGNFAAPGNADYEMAEIILKAIAPNPADRWQDPVEMGQALVSYMQRNGANDIPILPPVIVDAAPLPVEDDEDLADMLENSDGALDDQLQIEDLIAEIDSLTTEEPVAQEGPASEPQIEEAVVEIADEVIAVAEEDAAPNTADTDTVSEVAEAAEAEDIFGDETAPENNIGDVEYDEVSDDLMEILAQADELVAHPVPDPVVAPEAIEIPDPVIPETDIEDAPDDQSQMSADTMVVPGSLVDADLESELLEEASHEEADDDDADIPENSVRTKKKSAVQVILNIVIIVLLVAILALGFFYYKNIYLLPIDSLTISGNENSLEVSLSSQVDESLLSVICSDSHGTQIGPTPVVNGKVIFNGLSPDTVYNIQIVLADGFHRLTGETVASYSTPAQTNVVQFSAVTGNEDGSVTLSFVVEGPDNGEWQLVYSASGEEEKTMELLSHMATITGLTIGKEYTFTLIPSDTMYVTGQTQVTHTASELVEAEGVSIVSCIDGKLSVIWSAPEDTAVSEWTVRCYDDSGYNQTFITADTTAVFENVDSTKSHTVEVTAAGMSIGQRAYMAANAITISNFQVDPGSNKLTLTWDASQEVPEDGWVLLYTVDGSETPSSVVCNDNRAVISPIVPDANYAFTLQRSNGDAVLTTPMVYQTAKAKDFSGYGMVRASMTSFKLCKRPSESNWDQSDVSDSDYTSTFKVGESISIVCKLDEKPKASDDKIIIMYVFRDATGNVASYSSKEETWDDMWRKTYGEFDIPEAPGTSGEYTLSVYFNGKLVRNKTVTITE